jgi:phosphatidylglycerophosphate synthase
MIDSHFGTRMDKLWGALARPFVRRRVSPNAITCAGFLLVAACAGAYLVHRNSLIFAASLAVSFAFDAFDGVVARATGRSTRLGGYLDAIADRYQELIVIAAIACVRDLWPVAFLVITGSFLTSYAKARTALEIAISNTDWPDLIERLERLMILLLLLALDGFVRTIPGTGLSVLGGGLFVLGVLTHATAAQRALRAMRRIDAVERARPPEPSD